MRHGVIGLGYVGTVTAACLADLGHRPELLVRLDADLAAFRLGDGDLPGALDGPRRGQDAHFLGRQPGH